MIPVQFRPAAIQDVLEAVDWYEAQRPGLGAHFFEDLDRVLSRIEASRGQFPSAYRNAHRALLRKFPYAVFSRLMRIEHLSLLLPICAEKANVGNGAYDV